MHFPRYHQPLVLQFRVYAVEGSENQTRYALEFGVNVTNFFEQYFGLDYPLPKMGKCITFELSMGSIIALFDAAGCTKLKLRTLSLFTLSVCISVIALFIR